jgi:Asp-tRNA(Asn)/Glu-tRNA(Gln) amidotransferase A subunit family amidase
VIFPSMVANINALVPDDPDTYHGAPASIQLVGRRLEEEKLLSIAKVVVDALASS